MPIFVYSPNGGGWQTCYVRVEVTCKVLAQGDSITIATLVHVGIWLNHSVNIEKNHFFHLAGEAALYWRMNAYCNHRFSEVDEWGPVHFQGFDGRSARRGETEDKCSRIIPTEVLAPKLSPGVKKRDTLFGYRVCSSDFDELVGIAAAASVGKVFGFVCTTQNRRNDVFNVERPCAAVFLADAVFTVTICACAYKAADRSGELEFTHSC